MRSCSIRFTPARRLSEMSDLSVTLWFVLVASLNASMVAPRASSVMPMAIMNSISVNPDCLFMMISLPRSSRKRRDIADERVGASYSPHLVVNGDRNLSEICFSGHTGDSNGARHPGIQIDDFVVGRAQDTVGAWANDDGIREGCVVIRSTDQSIGAGI